MLHLAGPAFAAPAGSCSAVGERGVSQAQSCFGRRGGC